MRSADFFVVGGTVQAGRGLYIERRADHELLQLCRDGTFAYVLYARQVGKSSLIVRAARRLRECGILPVFIDLTILGANITVEQWYWGFLDTVVDQLSIETDLSEWWSAHQSLGQPQRMITFFREVVLREKKEQVVIFVDEIDMTLSLPFTDDYFAALRAMYNARPTEPEFNRLSFVLTGVATPGELMSDPRRTPFNIGETVNLNDFTIEEALPLCEGLRLPPANAQQVLSWVLNWSGGHPYLTLRICRAVVDDGRDSWSENEIDDLVKSLFFYERPFAPDNNLMFVSDMLTRRFLKRDRSDVLLTYRNALLGRPVPDDIVSVVKSHLKLSGVVKSRGGMLRVRNAIYREAFNEQWVNKQLPYASKLLRKSWWRS